MDGLVDNMCMINPSGPCHGAVISRGLPTRSYTCCLRETLTLIISTHLSYLSSPGFSHPRAFSLLVSFRTPPSATSTTTKIHRSRFQSSYILQACILHLSILPSFSTNPHAKIHYLLIHSPSGTSSHCTILPTNQTPPPPSPTHTK